MELIHILVTEHAADVDRTTLGGESALHKAVQGKQARAVEVLSFTQFTRTKVQIVKILTSEELLEALLHLGANPNIRTGLAGCPRGAQPGMGWTPLFRAGSQFTCFTSTPAHQYKF